MSSAVSTVDNYKMAKLKKNPSAVQKRAQKKAKTERQKNMWVFMNGKQVRIKRSPTIDGMDIEDYVRQNADPIWLHQNEMWEHMESEEYNNDAKEPI